MMKRTIFMAAVALLISAGLSAQDQTRGRDRSRSENKNRSAATVQTQTGGQYQNYGQMTSEQKRLRNEERKALKAQRKALKREQKQIRKQEPGTSHDPIRNQDRIRKENPGGPARNPGQRAGRISGGMGRGRR